MRMTLIVNLVEEKKKLPVTDMLLIIEFTWPYLDNETRHVAVLMKKLSLLIDSNIVPGLLL